MSLYDLTSFYTTFKILYNVQTFGETHKNSTLLVEKVHFKPFGKCSPHCGPQLSKYGIS